FKFNLFDGAAKAKPAEGRSSVGAAIRAQKAYYLENGKFTDSMNKLGVGILPETNNYRFQIWLAPKNGPFQSLNGSVFDGGVIVTATAKSPNLKSYTGRVEIDRQASQDGMTMTGICGTVKPSQIPPLFPTVSKRNEKSRSIVNCPKGSRPF
ncbi:MAG: type IV pilin-like G/H family protein, partial [Geitlerinemataceae cyanobacterium]